MHSNVDRESAKGGSNSNRDSIPDWVPYAESSVANKSSHDFSHSHVEELLGDSGRGEREPGRAAAIPASASVRDHSSRPRRKRLQRTMQGLWKLPSFLRRSSGKNGRSKRGQRHSWRTDEITEEFSISVVPPEEVSRPLE